MVDSDREASDSPACTEGGPSVASSLAVPLPVCFTSDRHRQARCKLCNHRASSPSPFTGEGARGPEALSGGFRPWAKYLKTAVENGNLARMPSGRCCLPCWNVFFALGPAIYSATAS